MSEVQLVEVMLSTEHTWENTRTRLKTAIGHIPGLEFLDMQHRDLWDEGEKDEPK